MKKLEILPETFEARRPPKSTGKTSDFSQLLVHLKLRFQAKALNRVYDYFDDTYIIQNDDGSFTLEVTLPDGEWIYGYILSFGSLVEVLEPESVRVAIMKKMRQALKIYNL